MDESEVQSVLSLVEETARELDGLDAKLYRDRLERRGQDIEPVFVWLIDHGQNDSAVSMACQLGEFTRVSGRIPQGRGWLDRALALPEVDRLLHATALYENGMLAFWQGDDAEARSMFGRSLDLARQLNNPTAIALALCGLARVALRDDAGLDQARQLCEEALEAVRNTDDRKGRSNALHVLGVAAQMRGDLAVARDFMTQRLELAREDANFKSVASEAGNLSVVDRQLGNLESASRLATEALEIADRRGDEWMLPYALSSLAAIAVDTREFARAATLLGAASAMMERQGTAWPPDEAPHFERSRVRALEAVGQSAFERAWAEGHEMSSQQAVAYVRRNHPVPGRVI